MKSMNLNKNRHAELDSASLNKRFRNKFGKTVFLLLFFSLSSCSNVFDKKLDEEKSSDKNTYIMIVPDGINIKDRSIEPIIEDALGKMQNINLYATKTADSEGNSVSGSKKRLPNNNISTGSLSTLYNQLLLLEDGAGSYTFDFSCSIDGVYFYQRLENQIIEESKTNLIEFNNLIPMKDSNSSKFTPEYEQFGNFGGIDIKLNFDNPRYMYKKVVVTLNDLSKSPDDEDYVAYSGELDISSKTSVRYQRSLTSASEYISASLGVISTGHIATGEYRITFDFYSKDITTTTKTGTNSTSTKENQKVNSLSYVVRVARGLNSIFEDTIDLNEVYTITYEDCHGSYSCGLSDGQVKVDSYTRKSQDIILPRYYRAYGIFEGWYTQPTGGDLVTNIPTGSSGNITLYAHWRELGTSGTPAVLYVDPTSTYPYGIDEDHALPSISEAVKFIGESVGSYHPWTLKIKGPLTENINIADNYGFNTYARSLTLEGITGLDENNIPQDEIKGSFTEAVENGATLAVNTKVPVIIKNLKITGGNNSNTGNIKGGGIYVGSYTYSSTTTPASVTLDDGALITGNSAPAGSGVYVSSGATFQMGGGAQVAEGDDVYLPDGTKLLITKMFDGDILHAATITPETYSEGTQVLDIAPNGSGSLHEEYSVFTVTSQNEGGTTTNWAIDTDGKLYINTANESNLYVSSSATSDADGTASKPFASLADALAKIETLDDTSAEYTIIVDGEIKSAESTTIDITKATSLIITGKSGNATNSLDAQLTGVPLIINTAVPVTVKNIKITKGSPYGIQLISGKLTLDENTLISENITGVYISGGEVIMTDGEISENETGYGAGVYISYDDTNKTLGKFTMSGGAISGNKATYGCGGGVLVDGTLDVAPEELAEYTGGDGDGHVLFTMSNGTISGNEENSTVTDDYEVGVGGGGVCVAGQYAKFVMSDSAVIKANTAPAYGAGVSVWNGAQFIMNGGTIGGSSPDDGNITGEEEEISTFGGGVYLGGDESSSFTMNNGTISNNKALGLGAKPFGYDTPSNCGGAGVGIFYGTFTMVNGNITSNNSKRHGGGIYIAGYGVFDMQGGSISENTCTDNGKGVNQNWTSSSGNTYKGQFKIKGDAVVASNNDIYLSDKLTITGSLNAANKVATLTPSFYDTSTIVLAIETEGGSVTLSDIGAPAKFLITPQVEDSVTTNWEIGSEGNLVKGSTTNNSGNGGIPEGFVTITGGTASTSTHIGTVENATDGEFTTLTIPDLWVSSELVTQYEYEQLMTYYGTVKKENTSLVPGETSETAKMSTPAYFVTWLDAIVYCNLRSEVEGLTPVYSLGDNNEITATGSTWTTWGYIEKDGNGKYYYNQTDLESHNDISTYDLEGGSFSYDLSANGYRLPTTAEYKNIKTKNPELISGGYDEWCQNYYTDYKRCMYDASVNAPVTDIYADTRENTLGFRVVRKAPENP